jgi:hypothetical protein
MSKGEDSGVFVARKKAIYNSTLTAMEKLVLLALNDRFGKNNKCWPSQMRLAKDISLSRQTVNRIINGLAKRRVLRTEVHKTRAGVLNYYIDLTGLMDLSGIPAGGTSDQLSEPAPDAVVSGDSVAGNDNPKAPSLSPDATIPVAQPDSDVSQRVTPSVAASDTPCRRERQNLSPRVTQNNKRTPQELRNNSSKGIISMNPPETPPPAAGGEATASITRDRSSPSGELILDDRKYLAEFMEDATQRELISEVEIRLNNSPELVPLGPSILPLSRLAPKMSSLLKSLPRDLTPEDMTLAIVGRFGSLRSLSWGLLLCERILPGFDEAIREAYAERIEAIRRRQQPRVPRKRDCAESTKSLDPLTDYMIEKEVARDAALQEHEERLERFRDDEIDEPNVSPEVRALTMEMISGKRPKPPFDTDFYLAELSREHREKREAGK